MQVLWQRDPEVFAALSRPYIADPAADLAYMEARMWTWTWYIQSKILRGELWEAVSALGFVRDVVLFSLLAMSQKNRYRRARFAEQLVGEHAGAVARTLGSVDKESLLEALRTTVHLYVELADPLLKRYGVEPARPARETVLSALEVGGVLAAFEALGAVAARVTMR